VANFSVLKKSKLGTPPPLEEASGNLNAPEIAPASVALPPSQAIVRQRIDGRTARRTSRTQQFATRVTPEFDERIRAIAQRDGLLLVEVLERALEAYESAR
jgi:hypothetical protein